MGCGPVVVVAMTPLPSLNVTVTPFKPGSPGSCTPLRLRSFQTKSPIDAEQIDASLPMVPLAPPVQLLVNTPAKFECSTDVVIPMSPDANSGAIEPPVS